MLCSSVPVFLCSGLSEHELSLQMNDLPTAYCSAAYGAITRKPSLFNEDSEQLAALGKLHRSPPRFDIVNVQQIVVTSQFQIFQSQVLLQAIQGQTIALCKRRGIKMLSIPLAAGTFGSANGRCGLAWEDFIPSLHFHLSLEASSN